jgi:hypothetical protein
MDVDTLIRYINNAIYKRDQARQQKETYINYASSSETDAQYHIKQAEQYRSQAKQYEDEELNAQQDVEYYQRQVEQQQIELAQRNY